VKFVYIKRRSHNPKCLLLVTYKCVPMWAYFLEAESWQIGVKWRNEAEGCEKVSWEMPTQATSETRGQQGTSLASV